MIEIDRELPPSSREMGGEKYLTVAMQLSSRADRRVLAHDGLVGDAAPPRLRESVGFAGTAFELLTFLVRLRAA